MRHNYETLDVDKIQDRWQLGAYFVDLTTTHCISYRCCGDEPWPFRELWEKFFGDFCDVEQKKFDLHAQVKSVRSFELTQQMLKISQVSELYDTINYCALHHRAFLFAIFDEQGCQGLHFAPRDRRIHELYGRAKAPYDLVAPQEYGIYPDEK